MLGESLGSNESSYKPRDSRILEDEVTNDEEINHLLLISQHKRKNSTGIFCFIKVLASLKY